MNKLIYTLLLTAVLYVPANHLEAKDEGQKKYQCQLISRTSAIEQAKSRVKGKVVGVQLLQKKNRSVYKVRMLVDKKRIKTYSIKACR